jgi:hypothetical protein
MSILVPRPDGFARLSACPRVRASLAARPRAAFAAPGFALKVGDFGFVRIARHIGQCRQASLWQSAMTTHVAQGHLRAGRVLDVPLRGSAQFYTPAQTHLFSKCTFVEFYTATY